MGTAVNLNAEVPGVLQAMRSSKHNVEINLKLVIPANGAYRWPVSHAANITPLPLRAL
jgi:hypothetical protein